jgi:hypothetical protein
MIHAFSHLYGAGDIPGGIWRMLILFSLTLLLLSGVIFYLNFMNHDAKPSELYTVEAPLETSFWEKAPGSLYQYVILLEDSGIKYGVDSTLLDVFDKDGFEREVAAGDVITILTEKESLKTVLRGPYHIVYSLQSGGKTYLSPEDVAESRKGRVNFVILGFASAGAAVILLYVSIRKLKSIRKRAEDLKKERWDLPF